MRIKIIRIYSYDGYFWVVTINSAGLSENI